MSVRSDENGVFTLDKIPPGDYVLLVRRVGFEPIQRQISVAEDTRGILIRMVPLPYTLPLVVTKAARIGVGGIVLDENDTPIPGAQVTLNGSRKTKSGDDGRFFLKTPTGRYLLQVRADGFASRLVSVTVADSGGEVAVWLTAASRDMAAREAAIMERLRLRLLNRSPVWSKVFTRDDINRVGFSTLEALVVAGAGHGISDAVPSIGDAECMAVVDGTYRVPVWSVDPAEVEFAEVYASRPARPSRGNLRSGPRTDRFGRTPCPVVYIWLRK